MPGSTTNAPWGLARSAQLAVAAAASTELFWALAHRARLLHPAITPATDLVLATRINVYVKPAAIVLFLVWFARCRRNADLLSPGAVRTSVSWAVLAWLLPVFNLWAPRGLVQDVLRASAPSGAATDRSDVMVNVWWAAWTGHAVLYLAGPPLGYGTSLPLLVAAQALDFLAAALVIAVIQRITARQAAGLGPGVPVPVPDGLPHAS